MTGANAPGLLGNETYTYDPLDNIRQAQFGPITLAYLLDPNGKNRLDQINLDGQPFLDYDSNDQGDTTKRNRMFSDALFANGFENASTSMAATLFAAIAPTQVLVYDRAHRLTGVNNIETYTYDAHGHRIATTRASDALKRYQVYSQAGQLLFTQDHRSNEIVDYISLDGNLVAQRAQPIAGGSQTVTYLHTDMRGTPVAETNAAGTPTQPRTLLAPYGSPYNGQYEEGPGFTGHATDANTGLSYMQQRFYDPIGLRFLSVDPVGASGASFNRYWYGNSNPYKFVDPDGREVRALQKEQRAKIEGHINARASGEFRFDSSGSLARVGDGQKGGSATYDSALREAISSDKKIRISIGETIGGESLADHGNGATGRTSDGNALVVINGLPIVDQSAGNLGFEGGHAFVDYAPDILAHELVGHAIPMNSGNPGANSVELDNQVRLERGTPLLNPDPDHIAVEPE